MGKDPYNRCDSQYKIRRFAAEETVEVDKTCRHLRNLRHVRVDNDSIEDPEFDEELYVLLSEDEKNKTEMLQRNTLEKKAPEVMLRLSY